MKPQAQRKIGRPSREEANEDRRQHLIEIAGRLISLKGYDGVSLKDIATEAKVTPAMISYYFGSKAELMRSVMEYAAGLLLKNSEAIHRDVENLGLAASFAQHHLIFMTENKWILQLFTREVLTKDSESRQIFQEDFGVKALALFAPKLREDQDKGRLKADLNPDFTQLSLAGMCIFPFLVAPVLGPVLGYTPDEKFAKAYGEHVENLFMKGAKPETYK